MRQTGQTGDKIQPTHGYRDRGKDRCGLLSGLDPFRLVIPPLQPGVVGPYLVWGTLFPSRAPLEGTGLYPDL
jgi:hypothetical protein